MQAESSTSGSQSGPLRKLDRYHLGVEIRQTAKLALPMVIAQLGQIVTMTIDLAIIGRLGSEAIAAAALAGRIYYVIINVGMGLLAALAPVAAQAFGAGNLSVVRRSLRMALCMALILSLPIAVLGLSGEKILLAFGQPPHAAQLAQEYLSGLTWGAAPALLFRAIRNFMTAVNRPEPVCLITLAAIPLDALLVHSLTYGNFGLPRLELFGAGVATALVNFVTFLAGSWIVAMRSPFRNYRMVANLWRLDWAVMRQLTSVGAPISISFLMESGVWTAATLLMGVIGTRALAAHQIAFQVAAVLFTIPNGISMAVAVRVGHAVGRNDGYGSKRAGLAGMLLGIATITVLTLAVVAARSEIAGVFLDEMDGADATAQLASRLVLMSATLFVAATIASIASGGLRGMKDTRVPLLFTAVAYWLVGFSISYVLALKGGLDAIGVWIGLSTGTAVNAALLAFRFHLLATKLAHHANQEMP